MKSAKCIVGALLLGSFSFANATSLYVDPDGQVGVGTDVPNFQLEVIGSDPLTANNNTTALYVTNNSEVPGGRVMLGLENNGTTRFSLENTSVVGARWVFAVGSMASFRISKADTELVEFEVTDVGDVNVAGVVNVQSDRNSKTNIARLDSTAVLEKVVSLPVSSWSYKDDPNVTMWTDGTGFLCRV